MNTRSPERVILVGFCLKSPPRVASTDLLSIDIEDSLEELGGLAVSAGGTVVGRLAQERERIDPAYFIGRGKLEQLRRACETLSGEVVIFDENLTPAQQRNLEKAVDCKVIDRTQLILDIFARRAATREGKLQVELAQLSYLLPRLAGRGVELSRLGGGIGTRGPGETKLETDQRKIRSRIHRIKEDLEHVRSHRHLHRSFRNSIPVPVISLVGYTNAGKSSLFNALTNASTLASDQLFATLDPLLRRVRLPSNREVILSDTVGFINKLPPTLVSAFRATLEEITEAALLLHVIDLSNPRFRQQRESVMRVLDDLKVSSKLVVEVYNKIDLVQEASKWTPAQNAVSISATKRIGIPSLLHKLDECLSSDPLEKACFVLGHSDGAILSHLHSKGRLLQKFYRGEKIYLEVEAPRSIVERLKQYRLQPENRPLIKRRR